MQRLMGVIRKGIQQYDLINDGDRIAIGVSGGKDSVALLVALARMRRFLKMDYEIVAITLDMGFDGKPGDFSKIEKLCIEENVEYHIKRSGIAKIVFETREERSPCSLCARMRRGALHDEAKIYGCNKVALGHHRDDAVETFFMNLFTEGRIGCFSPKSYLSRKDLYLIRPMALCTEAEVKRAVKHENLPVVKSVCPVDGHTSRQKMKEFIHEKERESEGFIHRVFGAMQRGDVDGW